MRSEVDFMREWRGSRGEGLGGYGRVFESRIVAIRSIKSSRSSSGTSASGGYREVVLKRRGWARV